MNMTGADLTTYMVEEMRRIVDNAFKPIHERLDQIEQFQQRPDRNFLQSIRRPRRGLVKEEKSCEEDFDNAYRHFYGSKQRRGGGARDREDIKLKNIPSIQKKHDHKLFLGGAWDTWIYEENHPLPTQQLEDAVTINQTSHRLNPKEMKVEVEVVVDINDEACLTPKELVEVDEKIDPEMPTLEDPNKEEEVEEIVAPVGKLLVAVEILSTQTQPDEREQRETKDTSSDFVPGATLPEETKELERQVGELLAKGDVQVGELLAKWAVKEERLIIVLRFKVQEKSELEPKKKNNAQGRKAMVQQSTNARNEDLIFDPGIWIDDLDLRTNPFQEEGNDACHGGPSYVAYVG